MPSGALGRNGLAALRTAALGKVPEPASVVAQWLSQVVPTALSSMEWVALNPVCAMQGTAVTPVVSLTLNTTDSTALYDLVRQRHKQIYTTPTHSFTHSWHMTHNTTIGK